MSRETRLREIVRGLLNFSRQAEPHKALSDLNRVLRDALNLMKNQARIHQVTVVEQLDPELPFLVMDAHQIQEVAVNVIVNVIDAMDPGGALTVRSRPVADLAPVDDQARAWVEFEITEGPKGLQAKNVMPV